VGHAVWREDAHAVHGGDGGDGIHQGVRHTGLSSGDLGNVGLGNQTLKQMRQAR
jgi:hypothetical protein